MSRASFPVVLSLAAASAAPAFSQGEPSAPSVATGSSPCVTIAGEEVDLVLNGDFDSEFASPDVEGDDDDAAASFWNGAEGRITGTTDKRLSLQPSSVDPAPRDLFAYQRIGVPADMTETVRLRQGWVRLPDDEDEAWVTLAEADGEFYGLRDFLNGAASAVHDATWTFYEDVPFQSEVDSELDLVPASTPNAALSSLSLQTGNEVRSSFVLLNQGDLIAEFEAPSTGMLRYMARPIKTDVVNTDVEHEVWLETGVDTDQYTLLDSVELNESDKFAPVIAVRMDVTAGQNVRIRMRRTSDPQPQPPLFFPDPDDTTRVLWRPVFGYEGRKLVYWFTRDENATVPSETDHHFIKIHVDTGISWYPIAGGTSGAGLCMGKDFELAFDEPARPPLDLILSVPASNGTDSTPGSTVHFDDFVMSARYPDDTEQELRQDIIDEIADVLADYRRVNDKDGDAPNDATGEMGKLGYGESPYIVHPLEVVDGPTTDIENELSTLSSVDCNVLKESPSAATLYRGLGLVSRMSDTILPRYYEDQLFDDHFWIVEQSSRRLHATTGVPNQSYDPVADEFYDGEDWDTTKNATFGANDIGGWLRDYELTGDVTYLQLAHTLASYVTANGVIPAEPCGTGVLVFDNSDCLAPGGYEVSTGLVFADCSGAPGEKYEPYKLDFHDRMNVPSLVIRTYVACREYDQVNGTSLFPVQNGLDGWVTPIVDAVVKIESDHKPQVEPNENATMCETDSASWGGRWFSIGSAMNDQWGYQGRAAHEAWNAISGFSPTTTADQVLFDALVEADAGGTDGLLQNFDSPDCDIVFSGATSNYPLWEESVARGSRTDGGDEGRCWPSFSHVRRELASYIAGGGSPSDDLTTELADQLYVASLQTTRFQVTGYDDGVAIPGLWCSWINSDFHYKNLSRDVTTRPPTEFLGALAEGLESAAETQQTSRFQDLLAVASEMLDTTVGAFKKDFGYAARVNALDGLIDPLTGGNPLCAGVETRFLEGMLDIFDELDSGEDPPTIDIDLDDFVTDPQATIQVDVDIHIPSSQSTLEMRGKLASNVKIELWEASAGCPTMNLTANCLQPDAWASRLLWSSGDVSDEFTITGHATSATDGTLVVTIPSTYAGGDFKIRARVWDDVDQWDCDTSVQAW